MQNSYRKNLEAVINELSSFLGKEYSSKFKSLTDKEDRHLFFLANILVKLKHVSEEIKKENNILIHPKTKYWKPSVENEIAEVTN